MIKKEIKENIGLILLDRPKQLNAINYIMLDQIKDALDEFKDDESIKAVLIDSKASKGFCAGGDLKEIYEEYLLNDKKKEKDEFFKKEFDLDSFIKKYPKPVISHWYGVVMGGGNGLTINSDLIIADETVNWAMPETGLGFTPDVGMGKYISKLPQALGQYVGLCGVSLESSDLKREGLAHILIDSKDYEKILKTLFDLSKEYKGEKLIQKFKEKIGSFSKDTKITETYKHKEKIKEHFSKESFEDIVKSLEKDDSDFAKKTLENLKARDPFMLTVQFEKYFLCKDLSYDEVLELDLKIINYAIKKGSLKEGIRTQMIDKEDAPSWPVDSLDNIDINEVKDLLGIGKTYKESLN